MAGFQASREEASKQTFYVLLTLVLAPKCQPLRCLAAPTLTYQATSVTTSRFPRGGVGICELRSVFAEVSRPFAQFIIFMFLLRLHSEGRQFVSFSCLATSHHHRFSPVSCHVTKAAVVDGSENKHSTACTRRPLLPRCVVGFSLAVLAFQFSFHFAIEESANIFEIVFYVRLWL